MSGAELEAYILEIERLKRRVAELEHAQEVHEWGAQLFTESTLPQLLLEVETGAILAANPAAARFYGYPLPELIGKRCSELSAQEHCWNTELVQRVLQSRYGTEPALHRTASGEVRELEAHYSVIRFRGREVIHAILNDVTERNRLMRELEASEQRYRTFMQLANKGIWRYEATEPIPIDLPEEEQIELMFTRGYLAECNPAYARMYGYDNPEELIGKKLGERVISDNPQNREMLRFFIRNGYRMELVESVDRDREGKERYILNSVVGVVENGSLVRAWGVQIDITELRRLQKELEQAYRLESIGRLAGGVAHDFNNVLTAILGYTEMALERATDETLRRYLEGAQKAAQRAAGLTRQLLAYARKQVSQPQLVSLPEWLDDARTLLARLIPESVRLELEIQPNIGSMTADPDQLTQILLNLAVNARDAMPAGGVLTIRVYSPPKTPDHVVLEVSDTGMGIPQEILPYIFEPFFTTKPVGQGTGMGLAAVRGIVDQMGGRIEVDTAVGKGTTFRVFLPREFRKPEGG